MPDLKSGGRVKAPHGFESYTLCHFNNFSKKLPPLDGSSSLRRSVNGRQIDSKSINVSSILTRRANDSSILKL